MQFFDINNIAISPLGYPVSYIELIGTLFGFVSVYFASRANILTWPTGIVNELFLLVLFYQVQLYADMILQVFFLITTIYGWYNWNKHPPRRNIAVLDIKYRAILMLTIIVGSICLGFLVSNLHNLLPHYFPMQAAFPYFDSLIMLLSVAATFLLARIYIDNWLLWIFVDIFCTILYFYKGIYFLSLEYLVFLFMAVYGYYSWNKKLRYG